MQDAKKGLELKIIAPFLAKPGEDIDLQAKMRSETGRGTVKRLELIAKLAGGADEFDYPGAPFGILGPYGLLFAGYQNPIVEYNYQGEMRRGPVRKVILARDVDLMFFPENTYDVRIKLQGPEDTDLPYLWKLTLAARVPFSRDPVAVAYIRPIITRG